MLKKIIIIAVCLLLPITTIYAGFNMLYPLRYLDLIEKYAEMYDLSTALVCAVIHVESRFRADAVSSKGASGLMQITRNTADWAADFIAIYDYSYDRIFEPEINIIIGTWYLNRLIGQFGETDTALAAYNAGTGNVTSWLSSADYSSDGYTLDYIPFGETRGYVQRVNNSYRVYSLLLEWRSN